MITLLCLLMYCMMGLSTGYIICFSAQCVSGLIIIIGFAVLFSVTLVY